MTAAAAPLFRFNVNPPWEHFSSLVREASEAKAAPSQFHQYHHLRSALYFAVGSIEAFLNQEMRKHLKAAGTEDDQILSRLKKTKFREKAVVWPGEFACAPDDAVALPSGLLDRLIDFNSLRGEVTHDKAKDHSVYLELDKVDPSELVKATREYIVRVREAQGRPYWYWLTSWNFVGMNGSVHWPCLLNNQQFMMALRHIGFDVPNFLVDEMDKWKSEFMTSISGFASVTNLLDSAACQPRDRRFPFAPRLCRGWWQDEHVKSCGEERPYPLPRSG